MSIVGWTALLLVYLKIVHGIDLSWGWIILLYATEIIGGMLWAVAGDRD